MKNIKTISTIIAVLLAISVNTSSFAQAPIMLKSQMLNSNANTYQVVGNTFYFKVGDVYRMQLWKSDGTPAGTVLVRDSFSIGIESMVNINNTLYFLAKSTFNSSSLLALWKSDGTESGTVVIRTFPKLASVGFMTIIDNVGYFKVDNSLWKTDGTDAGTVEVKNLAMSIQSLFYKVDNGIVFLTTGATGYQSIWKTDGTDAGTVKLRDSIARPAAGQVASSLTISNGSLYFWVANQGKLWKSDGTAAGTINLATIANVSSLTAHTGGLYFSAFSTSPLGYYLYKSDGTIAGTANIASFNAVKNIVSMNGSLYFDGKTLYDFEPYKSDGTFAGTTLLKDINVGAAGSNPQYLTKVMDNVVFQANDGVYGTQFWKTDGTAAGTKMAYSTNDTITGLSTVYMIPFNNSMLFLHKDDLYILEISTKPGAVAQSAISKEKLLAYPNPVSEKLILSIPATSEQKQLSLYNSFGQQVLSKQVFGTNETIDVSEMAKGVYFIQVETATSKYNQKVIVE